MSRNIPSTVVADASSVDFAVADAASREFLAPQRRGSKRGAPENLVTVTDLAQELGISARTLRFYEDKGLIAPQRIGAARVFSNRERARMILILRGKELGFSLREIRDYLDLYDADPRHETQARALLKKIGDRRRQLEQKGRAIALALEGLDDLERDVQAILTRANARGLKPTIKA